MELEEVVLWQVKANRHRAENVLLEFITDLGRFSTPDVRNAPQAKLTQ
jgi:hypothetical protein